MKYLIFDAGPIISLAMNGLLPVLEKLKENFNGEFIITPSVKNEVIDRPYKIKKFKLEAIKIENLIKQGVLKMSNAVISDQELTRETQRISKIINGVMRSAKTGEKISILHEGEASCIAFANLCKSENLIVIDERTTRVLFEAPESLENLMEKKLHTDLSSNIQLIAELGNYKFIRSAELLFVAYKKDLLGLGKGRDVLDGLLYALKYRGTTISSRDIDFLKKMA